MELISLQSFLLMLLAILIVRFLPGRTKDAGLALLTVYVLFAANTTWNFVITLGILFAVYGAGILIHKGKHRRAVCCSAVICLTAGLLLWKYANFFVWNINRIAELVVKKEVLPEINVSAPFGISYGFLILIAYVLGVYWKILKPKKNIFVFFHTVAFFPLWVMGPILGVEDQERGEELQVTGESLCRGSLRILWGVFKKLVIAGRCAVIVDTIYGDTSRFDGLFILIGTLLFVLQLYTEFSGAMDIVLGAAEIIGKNLPENFDRPFASVTIAEFWRRWHITLGAWLKSFILYPVLKSGLFQKAGGILKKRVGKKASGKVMTYIGLFISWFLIGLWHGGGWNYIFGVGIYFWILIVGSELAQPLFGKIRSRLPVREDSSGYRIFAQIRTTLLFSVGMLFFRAGSMSSAFAAIKALFGNRFFRVLTEETVQSLGISTADLIVLGAGTALLYLVSRLQKNGSVRAWLAERHVAVRIGVAYALFFGILIFGYYGIGFDAASFIYQGF